MTNGGISASAWRDPMLRLLLALLLGLQFFLLIWPSDKLSSPNWLTCLPVLVLLGALLLSVCLTLRFRQDKLNWKEVGATLLKTLLVICLPLAITLLAWISIPGLAVYLTLVAPLEIGVIISLTLGAGRPFLSPGVGALAWLGMGLVLLVAGSTQIHQRGNDLGDLVFAIIVVAVLIGVGLALIGGMIGRLLYDWIFKK